MQSVFWAQNPYIYITYTLSVKLWTESLCHKISQQLNVSCECPGWFFHLSHLASCSHATWWSPSRTVSMPQGQPWTLTRLLGFQLQPLWGRFVDLCWLFLMMHTCVWQFYYQTVCYCSCSEELHPTAYHWKKGHFGLILDIFTNGL